MNSLFGVLCAGLVCCSASLFAQDEEVPFPEWDAVESAVTAELSAIDDYEPGDMLAREDVVPLWDQLTKLGWTIDIEARKAIEGELLPASDFLVKQLRSSKQSRRFMRQVSRLPDGYDRLDHLRRLKYGERRVKELIRGPDGYKLIEYMTTSEGGKNLGKQLSRVPGGKSFNRSTGRIYTETDLLKRLNAAYDLEVEKRSKSPSPTTSAM